jgi:hypothetical protein
MFDGGLAVFLDQLIRNTAKQVGYAGEALPHTPGAQACLLAHFA